MKKSWLFKWPGPTKIKFSQSLTNTPRVWILILVGEGPTLILVYMTPHMPFAALRKSMLKIAFLAILLKHVWRRFKLWPQDWVDRRHTDINLFLKSVANGLMCIFEEKMSFRVIFLELKNADFQNRRRHAGASFKGRGVIGLKFLVVIGYKKASSWKANQFFSKKIVANWKNSQWPDSPKTIFKCSPPASNNFFSNSINWKLFREFESISGPKIRKIWDFNYLQCVRYILWHS